MQAGKLSAGSAQQASKSAFVSSSQNAPLRSRRGARPSTSSTSLGAFGGSLGSAADAVGMVSQVATTVSMAVGAWYLLGREAAYVEQDKLDQTFGSSQACPRCDGVGYEPCTCLRWSDGDKSGCASCSKTGYMPCRACRGGGTAVPLLSRVRKEPGSRS